MHALIFTGYVKMLYRIIAAHEDMSYCIAIWLPHYSEKPRKAKPD